MSPGTGQVSLRVEDNTLILDRKFSRPPLEEPQIIFLDAVWMIEQSGVLQQAELESLRAWFAENTNWLDNDEAANAAFHLRNNLSLYFDIQRLSVANFLQEKRVLAKAGLYSRARIYVTNCARRLSARRIGALPTQALFAVHSAGMDNHGSPPVCIG